MNLNHRDGELKEVFDDLEDAFAKTGVDFYLIGALARDTWYAKQDKNFRTTKDADFAIFVGREEEFQKVKQFLVTKKKNLLPSGVTSMFSLLPTKHRWTSCLSAVSKLMEV